ncbi:MAG: nucleotidyltransferase domain-containing protein [Candidatus Aenigmarchaeota archaeon]|nr:nucleotidyltransferase domain-containing protein [Candidatus Aenigmarchaeota archaeon]
MDSKLLKQVQKLCEPIIKLAPGVMSVWIFGSATRKTFIPSKSDIDVMVLIDDTKELDENFFAAVDRATRDITDEGKKKNVKIHFQQPKMLTLWWALVKHGEPWAITSIKDVEIIYDESGYIKLMHMLNEEGKLFGANEKAEKLLDRAVKRLEENRFIYLSDLSYEILLLMLDSARSILMYYNIFPADPETAITELYRVFEQRELNPQVLAIFEEYNDLYNKISKGHLSQMVGKDIDTWIGKARVFISFMGEFIVDLENERIEKELAKAYDKTVQLCEKALRTTTDQIPSADGDKFSMFKKHFIDTGKVSKGHLETLKNLYEFNHMDPEKRKKNKDKDKEKYLGMVYIKSLELAIEDVTGK